MARMQKAFGGRSVSALLDEAQQRPPALRATVARTLVGGVGEHQLLAHGLELKIVNAMELHAQIEDSNSQQFGGISLAGLQQRSPAFPEHCENGKQLFV